MALKRFMGDQAAKPKGLIGRFVGRMMGKNNLESNKWVVSQLGINENDNILEIGFGPGTAIQEIFSISKDVHISGIDISKLMVEQATKLNQSAVLEGKLDLRLGEVTSMPWSTNHFYKAFAINVIYLWPNLQNVFQEIIRVHKPNGIMAIYLAPVELMDELGFS